MKVLAALYKGTVQFAYVDADKYKNLELAFGVQKLPTAFLFRNGTWYQTWVQPLFRSLRTFIDGRFMNKRKVYRSFETPTIVLPNWLGPGFELYN